MAGHARDRLLLYAPVPAYRRDGQIWVEAQAVNGLRLWATHFSEVTVMMPVAPGAPPAGWRPVVPGQGPLERIALALLPTAYRTGAFLRHLPATRARIRRLIEGADYLSFAIGGLIGDWGAVAALTASAMGRRFAVWTDRVESEVERRTAGSAPWRRRLKARLSHRPMAALERLVIRRAALGLFHGRETYDHYARYCRQPHVVHNIHLAPGDHIGAADLAAKQAELRAGVPLRLIYTGRAEAMKGPFDWLDALRRLKDRDVVFSAEWLGVGALLPQMRERIAALGLEDRVQTPGFVADHHAVLAACRASHLFLFCHLTPESPRCLIEALACGAPLVGYDGAFARDLIQSHGGGVLVPMGEAGALAAALAELDADRDRLAALLERAALDGAPFTDEAVFAHRAELIRTYLS
ncbi:glycosyltransferase [Pseudodonghicola flavimaris]|uniref:Glycosyltransferase n=1 Tax=Pseudodonghicola flavimaris TaxID=3050036 RepID=A0ABT7EUS9_9RHOB|nr:glycosyltransferase [Pseudodonghicola flavimaris]MDK3016068.1 glycosyltransferase [Pseudodonghicola flavimaris]